MLATLNKPSIEDSELFARIKPIVGDGLLKKRVLIVGNYQISLLLEYLVSCGLTHFEHCYVDGQDSSFFADTLEALSKRLQIEIQGQVLSNQPDQPDQSKTINENIDLIIGSGDYQAYQLTRDLVKQSGKTGMFYSLMANGSGLISFLSPDKLIELPCQIFSNLPNSNLFSELHLVNIVANYAKGLLLKGTRYARLDIEKVVDANDLLIVGHPSWPWVVKPIKLESLLALINSFSLDLQINENSSTLAGKTCLIIGLGSLGSVIAEILAKLGANLILIDGENVDAANPIRQIYRVDQIGQAKASACAEQVAINSRASRDKESTQKFFAYQFAISPEGESLLELESLFTKHKIDVAIVATGTANDRIISQTLISKNLPHVIVSCYARARFFEAIVINGKGSPCFGCIRGHLYLGKTPSLTPEQRARYISSEHDLTAEPATRVETGRAADLAAHIAYSLLNLDKNLWLARALAEEQTFFLGGNASEEQLNGDWAYTIELPGEVKLFGLQDITGRGDYIECWDCGRKLPISIPYQGNLL